MRSRIHIRICIGEKAGSGSEINVRIRNHVARYRTYSFIFFVLIQVSNSFQEKKRVVKKFLLKYEYVVGFMMQIVM
jgi:hypothetical protein